MADPQAIAKRLRENRDQQATEAKVLGEQLALKDVIIDEYDELINKLDVKIPPLVTPINQAITAVETADHNRISHGCRCDLVWQLQESNNNWYNQDVQIYKVVKDPATFQFRGYYGPKYWKYPKNREYGSNVVEIIDNADAIVGVSRLVLFDEDAGDMVGLSTTTVASTIKVGDLITDSLDDAVIFQSGSATAVVGLGTTSYAAKTYAVSGFCTSGDNKVYGDNKVGFITDFTIGDSFYGAPGKTGGGVIPNNTTITGFGTAIGIVSYTTSNGIQSAMSVTLDYATLSNPVSASVAATIGTSFYVGVVSTYYSLDLSAQASVTGLNSSFLVVRPGDTSDIDFESSKNPIDPVEIGIARGANIGRGHKLELTNNGDPDIVAQWSQIKEEPEPAVGAGRIEYWIGTTNWPVYLPFDADGGAVDPIYAAEGHQIVIAVGGTANSTMTYENVPPGGSIPGDCGSYDAAITAAEEEMNNLIAQNTPIINHYISGADTLRQLRNTDETEAWGYLQAIGFLNAKGKRQLAQAEKIEDYNWTEFT